MMRRFNDMLKELGPACLDSDPTACLLKRAARGEALCAPVRQWIGQLAPDERASDGGRRQNAWLVELAASPCVVARVAAERIAHWWRDLHGEPPSESAALALLVASRAVGGEVAFSVVGTVLNGWITCHRLHNETVPPYLFGCGGDSRYMLAHYLRCVKLRGALDSARKSESRSTVASLDSSGLQWHA